MVMPADFTGRCGTAARLKTEQSWGCSGKVSFGCKKFYPVLENNFHKRGLAPWAKDMLSLVKHNRACLMLLLLWVRGFFVAIVLE